MYWFIDKLRTKQIESLTTLNCTSINYLILLVVFFFIIWALTQVQISTQ